MKYKVIGLMSGTSLDGVDLAFCTFDKNGGWDYEINAVKTYPYSNPWLEILGNVIQSNKAHLEILDKELGLYFADLITDFCDSNQLIPDFISSHGHTVFHQPEKGLTLQIGNGSSIATSIKTTTINDFRTRDVQMGGQGAPLVPIGDKILFSEYNFCLNLGGFANISFDKNEKRQAFDICPMNMAFNELAAKIDQKYDEGGAIASSGDVDTPLLRSLNNLEYYKMKPPKSLGREWYLSRFKTLIEKSKLSVPDKLATCAEHFSQQIAGVINENGQGKVLITGGGAYNSHLIGLIEQKTASTLVIPEPEIVEFKEAIIFAFLGVLRMRNEINVLSSVTGASKDHCSGVIHNP